LKVPAGWQIVSALRETQDPTLFTASDYDTLVDSPTEMGRFDVNTNYCSGYEPSYLHGLVALISPTGMDFSITCARTWPA
jgi:Peptidase M61 N-terminal domain